MNIDTTAPVVTRDEILIQAPFGKQTLLAEIAILDELLDTHSIQRSGTADELGQLTEPQHRARDGDAAQPVVHV